MLIVVALDIRIANRLLHRCGIQLDVTHAELFRRHEIVFVLFVVAGNLLFGHRLLRRQRVNIDSRFTHHALLSYQCRQLVGFTFQHKIGTGNTVNQLLGSELVTQRLGVLIGGHPHLVEDTVIAAVIKFAVNLEGWGRENRLFNLLITDTQFQLTSVLIQQRLVDQTIQHLLTQGFHIAFIRCQLGVLIAQLLLHAITLAVEGVLELPTADFLVIHFCGVVIASANQVTTHAGQYERHDNDTENNLEHETVCSRA